jgi:hypothetical protein
MVQLKHKKCEEALLKVNTSRASPKLNFQVSGAHGVSSFHDLINEFLGNRFKGELPGNLFKTLAVGAHLSIDMLYQKIGNPFLFCTGATADGAVKTSLSP